MLTPNERRQLLVMAGWREKGGSFLYLEEPEMGWLDYWRFSLRIAEQVADAVVGRWTMTHDEGDGEHWYLAEEWKPNVESGIGDMSPTRAKAIENMLEQWLRENVRP